VLEFTRSDSVLLAALIILGGPDGQPVGVQELVGEAEMLNVASIDFDQISFGLPRLVAGGFALTGEAVGGGILVQPTGAATELVHLPVRTWDLVEVVDRALATRPYPDVETEDRSQGRLPGLDESGFAKEAARRNAWRDQIPPSAMAAFESIRDQQVRSGGRPTADPRWGIDPEPSQLEHDPDPDRDGGPGAV